MAEERNEKRKLIKYPKYFFLGLFITFKKDPGDFLFNFSLSGLIFGVPVFTPILYWLIGFENSIPVGLQIFLSALMAIMTWWGISLLLATVFILLPKAYRVIMKFVELGEAEEYKIFKMLKNKGNKYEHF